MLTINDGEKDITTYWSCGQPDIYVPLRRSMVPPGLLWYLVSLFWVYLYSINTNMTVTKLIKITMIVTNKFIVNTNTNGDNIDNNNSKNSNNKSNK